MNTILVLSRHTVRELTRNKLLYILLVFAVLLILGSLFLARLTIGQWARIINDVGLATTQLSGALVAIFVGVSLVAGEVDRKTIYVTLAKPVSRAQFVLGRYLGLCANLLLLVVIMGAALAAVLGVSDNPMTFTSMAALALIFVELCVLAALALVFSTSTTPTLGVIFSISLFVIGHTTSGLLALAERVEGVASWVLVGVARVLPNLELFNLKSQAANGLPVETSYLFTAAGYGLVYAGLGVALAAFLFSRRDLR